MAVMVLNADLSYEEEEDGVEFVLCKYDVALHIIGILREVIQKTIIQKHIIFLRTLKYVVSDPLQVQQFNFTSINLDLN